MRIVLKNFRIVDEETDMTGQVLIDEGIITSVLSGQDLSPALKGEAAMIIDGRSVSHSGNGLPVLMPAFVDLHAHFRDPGFPEKETLESASLAAVAGGFGTVVCMANTKPVIDSPEKVRALKKRSEALALIDLYPVMSLTRGMEGKELSELGAILPRPAGDALAAGWEGPLALSEDGKDLADDSLFLAAMGEAKRIGIPISCHCDFGGDEAEVAKNAGQPRSMWSRIEENNAVRRVIELGKKAGCHIHIAHVSTKEAAEMIRRAKAELAGAAPNGNRSTGSFKLTCEVMPHNLCLTEEDARRLGDESWGRVNPPLHSEEDRKALIRALADGIIDAIATDHAPHSNADKEKGTPGFSGFETAFAAVCTELVRGGSGKSGPGIDPSIDLKRLSSLMSARPARLLGLEGGQKRGRIKAGYRADLVMVDTERSWIVDPETFKTRGKNSPFNGRELFGKILLTINQGRVVYHS